MIKHKRVAILGAGVSGLTAAYHLHKLDPALELTLFESSDRVGGVIQTEALKRFRIEHGPDSLLTQVPWGLDFCRRLGIANELVGTNERHLGVYVVCRGRLRRLPDGLALMAPQRLWPVIPSPILSIRGKLRLACEYFLPRRQQATDESLTQFITRRLGREAFERLIQPLVSGIYMGSPDSLSIRATFPRFVEMEAQHGSLIRAMRAQKKAPTNQAPRSSNWPSAGGPRYGMFVAPRGGMEQIPQAIAACLPEGALRLRCQVQEMTNDPQGRWRIATSCQPHERHSELFDAVIVATSASAAGRILRLATPSLAAELGAIDYTSCVVVNLALRRDQIRHPLDTFGFVSPRIESRSVTACTFSSVKYASRAPAGWCLLRVFLGGAAGPEALDWSADGKVKQVVLQELKALLDIRSEPSLFIVRRLPRVMPQYELGHLDRVDRIERIVNRVPGLTLAGNAYHGAGVAHCIHSGELAAEQVHEYFESAQCHCQRGVEV